MSDYATKNDLKELSNSLGIKIDKVVNKAVDDLSGIISNLAQSMHGEILELKKADARLEESLNKLTNTIDGFLGRIDNYETEMAARDHQFEKLLAWARKVSEKTGIPLENL